MVSPVNRLGLTFAAAVGVCASLTFVDGAVASLPDGRGYELVSPVAKNGVRPYAAVPSLNGDVVDFQAPGAFAGATSGSLNLYQATRTTGGWQSTPLTPTPPKALGALEEQAPVWFSRDLSRTIFTTPESYAPSDEDGGALSLYLRDSGGGLTWLSQGAQGGSEPNHVTFDGATPDASSVVFSSGASLLPAATGLNTAVFPEPEYLYKRDVAGGQTSLLSLDSSGQPVGYAATVLSADYTTGHGGIEVARAEGFAPGGFITIGAGESAETTQILHVHHALGEGATEELVVHNGEGLSSNHPAGTTVTHPAEGAILGDGGHLTSGPIPAGEFLPANAGSGSTTNAISSDGANVFFESPSPTLGQPVSLYMRHNNSTTVKIAGGTPYGATISGLFGQEETVFGSARYEGAAADGSLAFFTSEEGLAGATIGRQLYEFNATEHEIGGAAPMSTKPVSIGLQGDRSPTTTLTVGAHFPQETITVASTEGFHSGETILFGKFETLGGNRNTTLMLVVKAVTSPTELTLTTPVNSAGFSGIVEGTEVHGVHLASVTAISNDGSHVYFVSDGALAANANAEGATATAAQPNLYAFDTGTGETTFIGTLVGSDVSMEGQPSGLVGEPDISRPAIPTPDGSVVAFASAADLTGQNPWQEYTEIYRYAVAGNTLECVSCTAPGVKPTGNANFGETAGGTYDPPGLSSPITEDGSQVFFDTPDSLVPEDTNGGAPLSAKFGTPTSTDVYEAEGGKTFLISSGTSTNPSILQATTPSGDDVLFTTTAKMVPENTDGGYENVIDARVGGGFPSDEGSGAPTCVGESCRAAFGVAPVLTPPASTTPQNAGNPPTAPTPRPVKCRKGFVKKRVKGKILCAKKRANKTGHASRKIHRAVR
ncbi:MAG TPA: hypothetical protein VFY36_12450 [Solirubrobacteraceae bacterium]|nr:hypothetical protein [Solirubrobacteraceae bacterium]